MGPDEANQIAGAIDGALRDAMTKVASAVEEGFSEVASDLANAVEDASKRQADAIEKGVERLGNGGAATPMGALEAHGKVISEALQEVASSISDLAEAIRETRGSR